MLCLKAGNKSDRIDARKLAELLRAGLLSAVYHGETGLRTLKELCRSYLAISESSVCERKGQQPTTQQRS
jgi:hypothetical protein